MGFTYGSVVLPSAHGRGLAIARNMISAETIEVPVTVLENLLAASVTLEQFVDE